jgi:hypothetical protein
MLNVGTSVFISIPDETKAPIYHLGKVIETDAEMFMAEFSQVQALPVGFNVNAFGEVDGKFYRQSAVVKEVNRVKPCPIMTFQRSGPLMLAEKRASYRVHISRAVIAGRIGDEMRCAVTDVSPEGFGAITSTALEVGSFVNIHIQYEAEILRGQVRIQSINAMSNGKHRCGFLVPERDAKMRRSLERIASMIQRKHLRTIAGFRALDENVEVSGKTIGSIIEEMDDSRVAVLEILAGRGIVNPQPEEWYQLKAWLDACSDISAKLGTEALYGIGLKIPANINFPPRINSLDKALRIINSVYHINHRNGEIGHYFFRVAGEKSYEVVCENPYPCDFDRGMLEGFCNRFKPKGSVGMATVAHEDSEPCRKNGATSCTFLVTW